ncbi:MAG: hypothetical protein KGY42_06740 [Desulfobacterales bacterium]|nr:hypothetical protein [Desulfobacterales bacterium]MBS3755857.1 hypothetical protein [Desulfobacterales bacterium]
MPPATFTTINLQNRRPGSSPGRTELLENNVRCGFTLTDDRIIQVSELAHDTAGFKEWLIAFHGKPIQTPQRTWYYPVAAFVNWHIREVFKGYARQS